nr:helix-turn-helix domain-containing protein [Haliangium sp. UPWRP_2]
MPGPRSHPGETSARLYKATDRYQAEALALGKRVRALRKARGLTLYQASAAMDIELRHLQRLETGVLNVTLVTLLRVADGLQVPVWVLLGGPRSADDSVLRPS